MFAGGRAGTRPPEGEGGGKLTKIFGFGIASPAAHILVRARPHAVVVGVALLDREGGRQREEGEEEEDDGGQGEGPREAHLCSRVRRDMGWEGVTEAVV